MKVPQEVLRDLRRRAIEVAKSASQRRVDNLNNHPRVKKQLAALRKAAARMQNERAAFMNVLKAFNAATGKVAKATGLRRHEFGYYEFDGKTGGKSCYFDFSKGALYAANVNTDGIDARLLDLRLKAFTMKNADLKALIDAFLAEV